MQEFIDPSAFENDDELLGHLIEHVVLPNLCREMGEEELDPDELEGSALVFGGAVEPDMTQMERVQELVMVHGMSIEYALREHTDYDVGKKRELTRGGLTITFIELQVSKIDAATSDLDIPSAEDLAARFEQD